MEKFMKEALIEAKKAFLINEVPVGCVFIYNNKVIAGGTNLVNKSKNATRHAELVCIDQVMEYSKKNKINHTELFKNIYVVVTVEPCIMCTAALCNLNVKEILYGCDNDRFGGYTVLNVNKLLNSKIKVTKGYQSDECMQLLKIFYKGVNPTAPLPKKKN